MKKLKKVSCLMLAVACLGLSVMPMSANGLIGGAGYSAELEKADDDFKDKYDLVDISDVATSFAANSLSENEVGTVSLVDENGENFAAEIKKSLCVKNTSDVFPLGEEPPKVLVVTAITRAYHTETGSETSPVGGVVANAALEYNDGGALGNNTFSTVYGSWSPTSGTGLSVIDMGYRCSSTAGSDSGTISCGTTFFNDSIRYSGTTLFLNTYATVYYYNDVKNLKLTIEVR